MRTNPDLRSLFSLAAASLLALVAAEAEFVAYHDFGATTGFESTGNITTHQSGTGSVVALDTDPKELINFADGSSTGVFFSVADANAMDARNGGETGPPAAATPADALFNVAGLNLDNGLIYEGGNSGSGATTYTLTGLNPNLLYDVAFYGHRAASNDGVERFTLGGADSATNSSSVGIIDAFTTDQNTRPNAATGDVVRWTDIDPGDDGIITIEVDPEVTSPSNIVYLAALRLEEIGAPAPFAITQIDCAPDAEEVTLTWRARRGTTYSAFSSTDLVDWTNELADSLDFGDDEIEGDGNLITATFVLADGLENEGDLFFRLAEE